MESVPFVCELHPASPIRIVVHCAMYTTRTLDQTIVFTFSQARRSWKLSQCDSPRLVLKAVSVHRHILFLHFVARCCTHKFAASKAVLVRSTPSHAHGCAAMAFSSERRAPLSLIGVTSIASAALIPLSLHSVKCPTEQRFPDSHGTTVHRVELCSKRSLPLSSGVLS